MKCMYCQGDMIQGTAPLHIDRKDIHISLDKVPAWVCSQCGEAYFDQAEVDAIQDMIKAVDLKAGKLAHPA